MSEAQALIVLGGGLIKDKSGHWRTAAFNEGDKMGITGDRLRVVAAAYAYHDDPRQVIIAAGGYGRHHVYQNAPTLASILAEELQALGVPEEKIIREEHSVSTYTQLLEAAKILQARRIGAATVISNEYHLPRMAAFVACAPELKRWLSEKKIRFAAAEKIALAHDRERWEAEIKTAYASAGMRQRQALEAKGVADMRAGRYQFR